MATRKGLVAQKRSFSPKSDDENGLRHPKKRVFRLKMVTRMGFVTQKRSFPAENGDEKGSRRPKIKFRPQKCRREQASSPKINGKWVA
ncbi:hypothetical protein NSQ96_15670 [Caldifermentibacillus hisashii]|uniref:hypothetical protein n=2 Tax=Caldifermentibacillus hisashii TaxID=996558 RepID=UPI0031FDB626